MNSPTAVNVTALAVALDDYHTLEVDAEGAMHIVCSVVAATPALVADAIAAHWRPGDSLKVEKYPSNWRVVVKRPVDNAPNR